MRSRYAAGGAIICALALACVSGCGSSTLNPDEQRAAASIAAYYHSAARGVPSTQVTCFANALVAKVGVDELRRAGILNSDDTANTSVARYPPAVAQEFADAYLGCVDYAASLAARFGSQVRNLNSDTLTACLRREVTRADYRVVLIDSVTGRPQPRALRQRLNVHVRQCVKEAQQ